MEMKQMYVQVVNLTAGKVFSLPTLYTDRVEACVCGQNYIRDRQAEKMSEMLFFRVLDARENGEVAPEYYLWDDQLEEEKDEFDWEDPACQSSRKSPETLHQPVTLEAIYTVLKKAGYLN